RCEDGDQLERGQHRPRALSVWARLPAQASDRRAERADAERPERRCAWRAVGGDDSALWEKPPAAAGKLGRGLDRGNAPARAAAVVATAEQAREKPCEQRAHGDQR